MTRRANRKKRLTVLYIVEHPNQEGDTCFDWTSQYCWTNGWNCLWRGHSVYGNRPLIPPLGQILLPAFGKIKIFLWRQSVWAIKFLFGPLPSIAAGPLGRGSEGHPPTHPPSDPPPRPECNSARTRSPSDD